MSKTPDSKKTEGPTRPVSDEELKVAFSGSAVSANKFYVTFSEMGVRVAFTEQFGDKVPPAFRTAINLSFTDARGLSDLLADMLTKNVKFMRVPVSDQESTDG